MTRPLVLGEAPSKTGDAYWQFPMSGQVGQRLCTWAGIEPEAEGSRYGRYYWPLARAFELRNVIERYPGADGKGAAFPAHEAMLGMLELHRDDTLERGRVIVCLGRRVQKQLTRREMPFYRWGRTRMYGFQVVVIPHPSGLTRNYNDPGQRVLAGHVLREAIARASRG